MNSMNMRNERERLRVVNGPLKLAVVALVLAHFGSLWFIRKGLEKQVVFLVPPVITTPLRLTAGEMSAEYLKDMGRFISGLAFNYNAGNVRTNFDDLLRLYAPESVPGARQQLYDYAGSVEKASGSSFYYLARIIPAEGNSIILEGDRGINTKTSEVSRERERWQIFYRIESGKFMITEMRKIALAGEQKEGEK